MTCSALCEPHPDMHSKIRLLAAVLGNLVTVLEHQPSHRRGQGAQSPKPSGNPQQNQSLQSVATAQTAGRRVGAGAGATPEIAAVVRHDSSLVRRVSLVGRSRTCPSCSLANRIAIRG
jgi:hypothetical protein